MKTYNVTYHFNMFNEARTKFTGIQHISNVFKSEDEARAEYDRLVRTYQHIYDGDLAESESTMNNRTMWIGRCKSHNHEHTVSLAMYDDED